MKSFIYTVREGKTPRDGSGTKKSVTIYRVARNTPVCVAKYTDTFMGDFQMVMVALEHNKLLPKAAFAVHEFAGSYKYGLAHLLEAAGFARFTRIG